METLSFPVVKFSRQSRTNQNMSSSSDRIVYICDEDLLRECDKIPAVRSRASMVHSLISSYGLTNHMKTVPSVKATHSDLKLFHSTDFVEYVRKANDLDLDDVDEDQLEYGFCYDCPPFKNLYEAILSIVGGSLTAATLLLSGEADVAINWTGGWHHAQRDVAEGFCYANDIVIAIEKLKEKFSKILYIDLDIHHGNGVENAFLFTKKVFTLSFHKYEAGFYPGTGGVDDIGLGNGKGFACNIPFCEGVSDETLDCVFNAVTPQLVSLYRPEAIVVQCGADCLNGDPLGQSNLTQASLKNCAESILSWKKPTLFLGGGGYNFPNTSRLWTYLTAAITNQIENISMDIPDEDDFFLEYGPDYRVTIMKGYQRDRNTREYLDDLIRKVLDNFELMKCQIGRSSGEGV